MTMLPIARIRRCLARWDAYRVAAWTIVFAIVAVTVRLLWSVVG